MWPYICIQNSNILEMWEISPKTRQNERHQCESSCFPAMHPPLSKKCLLLTFKDKITTSVNNLDGIGPGYMSHVKEICLKNLKT